MFTHSNYKNGELRLMFRWSNSPSIDENENEIRTYLYQNMYLSFVSRLTYQLLLYSRVETLVALETVSIQSHFRKQI